VAYEAKTSVYSLGEIERCGDAVLTALEASPLTEEELITTLDQPRGAVVIAAGHLERDGRITVDRQGGGRTYRLAQ